MTTTEKMTGLDRVVYRPAQAIAFAGSLAVIVYWLPKSLAMVVAGYIFYRVLYFQRGLLYRQGKSRVFILGSIAMAPFYLTTIITPPTDISKWSFQFSRYLTDNAYFDAVNTWLLANADSLIYWKYGLAWSLFYGVLLYILNVEMDNPAIRQNDLTGLQITEGHLSRYNDTWEAVFSTLTVCVLLFYSVPLMAAYTLYLLLTSIANRKIITILDGVVLAAVLVFSVTKFDLRHLLTTPLIIKDFVADNGLWETLLAQIRQFKTFTIDRGLLSLLVLPLAVRTVFNLTGREVVKRLEAQREQEQKVNTSNGVFIGHDAVQPVIIADQEFNQHALILGTTGSGKTTTLFSVVDSCMERGLPLIFLDGKGSKTLAEKIGTMAERHGRAVRVFALDTDNMPYLNHYNPFGSGNFTEWKNRVMALFQMAEGRGQQHFALAEEMFINLACQILYRTGAEEVDLKLLMDFLARPKELLAVAERIDPDLARQFALVIGKEEEDQPLQNDIAKMLNLFIYSAYGHLFDTEGQREVIKLKDCIKRGEVVLFIFNASSYPQDTVKAAKMVISDINSTFAELANEQGFTKTYCIFDEFASYASSNLSETIALHRSNGMHAIIGTQSLATVSLKSPETKRIAEELVACCSTYITQKIQHQEDVELMAKVMGTRPAYEVTSQIDSTSGGTTGKGTVKFVDEFQVNPQQIRELGVGEGYVYRKAANLKPVKVKFHFVI